MFNVGAGELMVILLIALIVLGPDKLPDAARKIGNVMGELRRMSSGFQNEIRTAFEETTRTPLEPVRDEPRDEPTVEPRHEQAPAAAETPVAETPAESKPDDPAA